MILAIDIGNTNIVLGCIEDKEILREARMATDVIKTSDQYCAELKGMLDLLEVDRKPRSHAVRVTAPLTQGSLRRSRARENTII